MKKIEEFEKENQLAFAHRDVLQQAFVHRSYVNENKELGFGHNERLEFLGDAVLELVVTDELFTRYPEKSEGELTAVRASIVNTKSLSEAALQLKINDCLLLSKGESKSTGRARSYILANTFEAVVGALYTDSGYEAARSFVEKNLFDKIESIIQNKLWVDSKSFFQEKAQEVYSTTPEYRVISESGPDHDKAFTMGVFVGNKLYGEGSGASKQDAEQNAARAALDASGWVD
ncbi:MAG: ribonuclease III [Candidatus Paceibacterota bacterium]